MHLGNILERKNWDETYFNLDHFKPTGRKVLYYILLRRTIWDKYSWIISNQPDTKMYIVQSNPTTFRGCHATTQQSEMALERMRISEKLIMHGPWYGWRPGFAAG